MSPKSIAPSLPRNEQRKRTNDRMTNLLLLSVIDANPHHDPTVTRETRLAKTREALFGEKPTKGRKAIQQHLDLFPLLDEVFKTEKQKIMRIVKRYQSPEVQAEWEDEFGKEPSPLRRVAGEHSAAFEKPMVKRESTKDWLRRTLKNMQVTSQDMADLEGLFNRDSPKSKRLQRIIDDLNAIGIACDYPAGTKYDDLTPKQE